MVNFWKDVLKILMGFIAAEALSNIYFAISGNFPLPALGMPQLTLETSCITIVFSLIIVGILVYLLFLRKRGEKNKFERDLKNVSRSFCSLGCGVFAVRSLSVSWSVFNSGLCLYLHRFFRK